MGASITLGEARLTVEPGDAATLGVTVRNTGSVIDHFGLEVLGDAAPWATAEPAELSLFPGTEGTATITFRPPRSAAAPAGPVRFGVMARSKEDPDGSSVEEGTLDVGAFQAPALELLPRTSHGSRRAVHELAVDNRGNSTFAADVTGHDADRLLRFDVSPSRVEVPAGLAAFAKVGVRPVRAYWRGPAKTRPFQLAVRSGGEDAAPLLVDGTFLQEAILPWWFLRAVVAAAGLLLAAILLWLFVLQPQIRSDALDALEYFGYSPRPGSAADRDRSPGVSPTPVPSGVVVVPDDGPLHFDRRLESGQQIGPPADHTLSITDLVFSNATGATGDLVLKRIDANGVETALLVLRLENFRDLDFHFVTPITVRAGENLALVANCVTGTTAPLCAPAVFLSGSVEAVDQ